MYHYNVSCVVSDKHRFIVFLIAKNASSTIRAELTQEHYSGFVTKYCNLKNEQRQYEKYAFIRAPLERFLSGYFEVYLRHFGQRVNFLRNNIDKPLTYNFLSEEGTIITLKKFLIHIEQKGYFDTHIYPQSEFIKNIRIENYYTIENLISGINLIKSKCGILEKLPSLPKLRSRNVYGSLAAYYFTKADLSKEICTKIRSLYEVDFELYERTNENVIKP